MAQFFQLHPIFVLFPCVFFHSLNNGPVNNESVVPESATALEGHC